MPQTNFYKTHHLPKPVAEHVPATTAELEDLVTGDHDGPPRIIVGGGEHLREAAIGEQRFEAVRTEGCDGVLELDRESNLVRVEAGIRWADLRERLREDGYSLDRYRPYADTATVGGLLARHHATPAHRFSGDLREGCVGLSAVSPTLGEYRYMRAPRKASGPDLRHLFMGGEGLCGVILEATLNVFKPFPGRRFEWSASSASDAVRIMGELAGRGVRPHWCHWKRSAGLFRAVIYAPTRLLESTAERLRAHYGEEFSVANGDAVRELRRGLESNMPGRRSGEAAERTAELTFSLAHLGPAIDALEGAEDIDIVDWSPHAATAVVEFDEPLASETQWPAALDIRHVVGGPDLHWPEWAQVLKSRFDGDRRLAVGP
ncbi:MAG: FAD-binding oxidoreductase [Persicimonas sp.]